MTRREWPAPAKINLFLHVTGRRTDGYHLLQTAFQFLELTDTLTITLRRDGEIRRTQTIPGSASTIPPHDDLCVRAALRLKQESGTSLGADLGVTKRIPLGGGLGGGSSDAATTLLALNDLWELHWPRERLAASGVTLGADVPVFVMGHAAFAEGVGEQLTPIDLPELPVLLLWPFIHCSTARVFQQLKLTAFTPPITIRGFHAQAPQDSINDLEFNDLEETACALYPEIGKALKWLRQFGPARMTGSGSCVFLPVADAAAGQRLLAQVPPELGDAWLTRTVNTHPLAR